MKFKINRKELLSSLKQCSRLTRKRNETPVTDCVIIDVDTADADHDGQGGQCLRLRATDLEVWMKVHVEAEIEDAGCIAPQCVNLERIVSAITHDEVIISSQKDRIVVCPGDLSGKYPVNCLQADLFPSPDEGDDISKGRQEPREFLFSNDGIIDRVLAKNSGESKTGTAGVAEVIGSLLFLDLGDEFLTAAHHRGNSAGMEVSTIPSVTGPFDIPVPGALLVSGIEAPTVTISEKWVVFADGGTTITIRRAGRCDTTGELANARKYFASLQNKVSCNRFDLLGAIKRVKLCEEKREFDGAVYLELGGTLIVKGETGGGTEEINDVHLDGNTGRALIAISLLEHQLSVLGDNLSISFPDPGEGGVCQAIGIMDLDNENYLGFIAGRMP